MKFSDAHEVRELEACLNFLTVFIVAWHEKNNLDYGKLVIVFHNYDKSAGFCSKCLPTIQCL